MTRPSTRFLVRACAACLVSASLAACSSVSLDPRPPIESRRVTGSKDPAQKPLSRPGGTAGFHTVEAGESLFSIARLYGLDFRSVAEWNQLENPNQIRVGQVLRLSPPGQENTADSRRPARGSAEVQTTAEPSSSVQTRPLEPAGARPLPPPEPASTASVAEPVAAAGSDLVWPANGQLLKPWAPGDKGIRLAGVESEAVMAAADGKVIYAGNAIKGLGNFMVVQHEGGLQTTYAHLRSFAAKQGETVRRGQRIAELGSTDAERPMLYFETRRAGKPVNPTELLPRR